MRLFAIILAMGAVTYLQRLIPLLLLSRVRIPGRLLSFLEGFPVAVLAAFVAPLILAPGGHIEVGMDNLTLLAAVPTILVALLTRSLIATVLVGTTLMMLLRALL